MGIACVYGQDDFNYEGNGAAILSPIKALVSEEAGAGYELTLTHPVDPRGVWSLLLPGNIIKVTVPATDVESAISGENVDIWRVKASQATVYAKPSAPQRITYTTWNAESIVSTHDTYYPDWPYVTEGVKVTYSGQNYECNTNIMNEAAARVPPGSSAAWTKIANYTQGAAELTKLQQGDEIYLVSAYSSSWLYIQTAKGIVGYIQISQVEYVRTEQVEPTEARSVRTQLFRIYEATADSAKKEIEVKARHVSYDLAGNLIKNCAVSGAEAASALSRIRSSLLFEEECTLATNLDETAGTYTGDFSWKNPINALLDPDVGLVSHFRAKLIRDNWDLFLNQNASTDRGFCISYGRNLLGAKWKRDSAKLINRVVPVAQKRNGDDLLLPDLWVESPVADTYPIPVTEYLKVSGKICGKDEDGGTWTEETLLAHMRAKAEQRFSVDNVDKPIVEVDVNFLMLGTTEEYRQYRALERVCLYDTVRVCDPSIGLDLKLQVSAYEWDPILERFESIKLGNVFEKRARYVNSYNLVDGSIRYHKLSPDTITAIKEAVS